MDNRIRLHGIPVWRVKIGLFFLGLLPLIRWVYLGYQDLLSANPIEFLTRSAGTWTLVCLLVTLSITPLRYLTGQGTWLRLRRMCGLFCFFYASLHFTMYIWWDQWFVWSDIVTDVIKRPFITMGFLAYVMLIPLALTSTNASMRRLGVNWTRLHKLVYVIALCAILHYWWHKAGKNDFFTVSIYATVTIILLLSRLWFRRKP